MCRPAASKLVKLDKPGDALSRSELPDRCFQISTQLAHKFQASAFLYTPTDSGNLSIIHCFCAIASAVGIVTETSNTHLIVELLCRHVAIQLGRHGKPAKDGFQQKQTKRYAWRIGACKQHIRTTHIEYAGFGGELWYEQ